MYVDISGRYRVSKHVKASVAVRVLSACNGHVYVTHRHTETHTRRDTPRYTQRETHRKRQRETRRHTVVVLDETDTPLVERSGVEIPAQF